MAASSKDYERFFRQADKDRSGTLSFPELLHVLRKQGYRGSDAEIRRDFRSADTSGDGQISFEEYMIAMGLMPEKNHKQATMRGVFNAFDTDGNGQIDKDELQNVFKEMGKHFSDDEIKRMIKLADQDGSQTLSYEEFVQKVFGC